MPRLECILLCSLGLALPAAGQDLPPADQVIEAYVEAIGGRDAHLATESLRSTGTIEMPAMGIRGEFEVLQLHPNRIVTRIELPGVGQILSGFDGTVGWSVNPMTGPMILEGAELAQARERADLLAGLRDREFVPGRETVESAEYDGETCWRVRLRWRSGRESLDCYSEATGLLIASEESQVSPMGEIDVTMRFSDYREFQGIIVPTRLSQSSMGQTQEMVVEEVQVGGVSVSELVPPASIRTLLEGANR